MKSSVSILSLSLGILALLPQASATDTSNCDTQTEYDQDSVALSQQGTCRFFLDGGGSNLQTLGQKGLATCQQLCGKLGTADLNCISSSGPGIPTYCDPDGNPYTMGLCKCDIPLADEIINDVMIALPAIAEIGCEILFDSLDLVLELGSLAIPGEGEAMSAGMAAAIKAAKTVDENAEDASSFLQWFANPCGSTNYTAMIDNIFNPLTQVPDSIMPGAGCKKSPCPKKKPTPSVAAPGKKTTEAPPPAKTTEAPATTSKPADKSTAAPKTSSVAPQVSSSKVLPSSTSHKSAESSAKSSVVSSMSSFTSSAKPTTLSTSTRSNSTHHINTSKLGTAASQLLSLITSTATSSNSTSLAYSTGVVSSAISSNSTGLAYSTGVASSA